MPEHISHFQCTAYTVQILDLFWGIIGANNPLCVSEFPRWLSAHIGLCVSNADKTQLDGKLADHTFFFPPQPWTVTSFHCTTWEHSSFSVMWSRHALSTPRRTLWANPESSVSGEWAHSWTLLKHPDLWGRKETGWTSVLWNGTSSLLHVCWSLVTHHMLLRNPSNSWLRLNQHGFLQLQSVCIWIKPEISLDTELMFRRILMFLCCCIKHYLYLRVLTLRLTEVGKRPLSFPTTSKHCCFIKCL